MCRTYSQPIGVVYKYFKGSRTKLKQKVHLLRSFSLTFKVHYFQGHKGKIYDSLDLLLRCSFLIVMCYNSLDLAFSKVIYLAL